MVTELPNTGRSVNEMVLLGLERSHALATLVLGLASFLIVIRCDCIPDRLTSQVPKRSARS